MSSGEKEVFVSLNFLPSVHVLGCYLDGTMPREHPFKGRHTIEFPCILQQLGNDN